MRWVETIKVQTTGRKTDQACGDYLAALKEETAQTLDATILIYKNAAFPEQQMLCIEWNSPRPDTPQSSFSEMAIHELKQFGLVDHSAWILAEHEKGFV